MTEQQIYNVVIGTAGHIDHGKSTVVQRLTGVDPDRLPEEKSRGMTIDLGFAPMQLPSGEHVGIIDVPGHERFIKNMVAGASGIDLVILVVAADDSVMPQTREHLDIMTLLNLQRGVIVMNKIDLVDPEMLELVEEEIRELTAGTFLQDAPIYPLSGVTGEGFEPFHQAILDLIPQLPARPVEGVFRQPVQRVFSSKGHGTVVTGVPVSGSVRVGDRVEVLPGGAEGRVRGLQAYRITVDEARAGHSTAINLSDINYRDVHRGMVVATPGYFRATDMVDAKLRVLERLEFPLSHRMRVRFHCGTAEVTGVAHLLESKAAEPGEETFAQFRLDEPIVVAPGDRYVVRLESPMLTLGGGEVLDRSTWRLKSGKSYVLDSLRRKEQALGSQEAFVASILDENPHALVDPAEISQHVGLGKERVLELLSELEASQQIVPVAKGKWLAAAGIESGRKRVVAGLEECFREDSYRVMVPKAEIKSRVRLPGEFFEHLLSRLAEEGHILLITGGRVGLPGRQLELRPDEKKSYEALVDSYQAGQLAPQRLEELADSKSLDLSLLSRLQNLLLDEGSLVRLSTEVVLHKDALEDGVNRIRQLFQDEGAFSAARAKDVLDTTRKFAIPFLEYLDAQKITRRVGDKRECLGASDDSA